MIEDQTNNGKKRYDDIIHKRFDLKQLEKNFSKINKKLNLNLLYKKVI